MYTVPYALVCLATHTIFTRKLTNSATLIDQFLRGCVKITGMFSVRIAAQKLEVNSAIPGLVVQYSTDGGKSWSDVSDGMTVSGHLLLGTR